MTITYVDPPRDVAIGASRRRVLAVLQTADGPLAINAICAQVHLHPNTARFHLDALVEQRLVERVTGPRKGPGRPRALYKSTSEDSVSGVRRYGLLAQLLVESVATQSDNPARVALDAGEAWGRSAARARAVSGETSTAVRALTDVLGEYGFAPEIAATGETQRILLHHCPFLEAAKSNREVVCAVHLGLMRGVLAELSAPVQADTLDAFVEPNLCVAHLRPEPAE
ncbi:MAG: helix-turn-helix domain-containing protein [Allobranchiibius sp.]